MPLPSGDGSPATTLRRSATTGSAQVAAPVDSGEVEVLLVGTDNEVAHVGNSAIGNHLIGGLGPDRP